MRVVYLVLVSLLTPSIAFARKSQDLGTTMIATAIMVLLIGGIVWINSQWKKGNKKLAITLWIIIAVWFIGSIIYGEMYKH